MLFSYYLPALLTTRSHPVSTVVTPIQHRCKAGESCWPNESTWQVFNASISGRLIATYPSAAVCHTAHYNQELCTIAQQNWTNSTWRTSQPGAYSAILWELGEDQCFINATIEAPCNQGLVTEVSVEAQSEEDVQAAVRFANKHDLYLVVKNTGHDHLGRSSGSGALAIWTHNMKGKVWRNSFVPINAPNGTTGIPAVTLLAGEQWLGEHFLLVFCSDTDQTKMCTKMQPHTMLPSWAVQHERLVLQEAISQEEGILHSLTSMVWQPTTF
jgi:hypothetical protein